MYRFKEIDIDTTQLHTRERESRERQKMCERERDVYGGRRV